MAVRQYGFLSKEEKEKMPKIGIRQIGRMASYLKPFMIPLISMFIIQAVVSSIGLFPQIISRKIVDDALLGKK